MRQSKQIVTYCDGPKCPSLAHEHYTEQDGLGTERQLPATWIIVREGGMADAEWAFCCWSCARNFAQTKTDNPHLAPEHAR